MARATRELSATDDLIDKELAGASTTSGVAALLANISTTGSFATELCLAAKDLHVEVHGVGPLRFPISTATANKLSAIARPAPFGRRDQTLHDTRVRDSWEIGGDRIVIDAQSWQRVLEPALAIMRKRLGLPDGVVLEPVLDKLLVYGPGQFFALHQDSERSDDMVGTLAVELPSPHEGGAFVVQHRQEKKVFRGAGRASKDLSLLAFYADCHHEVKPVRSGFRIVLTYHLLRRGTPTSLATLAPAVVERLTRSVESYFATPIVERYARTPPQKPDRLIYLLDHEYTERSLSWDHFKNADRVRVAALREVAERLDCEAFLALADVHETWSCDDDWSDYGGRRRGRRAYEDDADTGEHRLTDLVDENVELRHWIGTDGRHGPKFVSAPRREEICFTLASVDMDPFKSDYEGYMGNYGNTMERWYHRAAFIMWPRARRFVIRARMSASWAVAEITRRIEAGATEQARGQAHDLLPFWAQIAPSESSATFVPALLEMLLSLDDAGLALALLSSLGPHRLSPEAMLPFAALVERHGQEWARQLFSGWAQATRHDAPWLPSLPLLCQVLARGQHGKALAGWLLSREVAGSKQRLGEGRGSQGALAEEIGGRRLGELAALLEAAAVIRASTIRDDLVAFLITPATALPLFTAGALLQKVSEGRTPVMVRSLGLQELHRHVVESLERVLAGPGRDPSDWSIDSPTNCTCALCKKLASFLRAKDRTEHAWPLIKDQRRHVHSMIDCNRLPVSHNTVRHGRPYTLMLTKQPVLFEQAKAVRARQRALLIWLKSQSHAFAATPSPAC